MCGKIKMIIQYCCSIQKCNESVEMMKNNGEEGNEGKEGKMMREWRRW